MRCVLYDQTVTQVFSVGQLTLKTVIRDSGIHIYNAVIGRLFDQELMHTSDLWHVHMQGHSDLQAAGQCETAVDNPETDAAASVLQQETDAQDTTQQQPKKKVSLKLRTNTLAG